MHLRSVLLAGSYVGCRVWNVYYPNVDKGGVPCNVMLLINCGS